MKRVGEMMVNDVDSCSTLWNYAEIWLDLPLVMIPAFSKVMNERENENNLTSNWTSVKIAYIVHHVPPLKWHACVLERASENEKEAFLFPLRSEWCRNKSMSRMVTRWKKKKSWNNNTIMFNNHQWPLWPSRQPDWLP